jgi:hypothetical protein
MNSFFEWVRALFGKALALKSHDEQTAAVHSRSTSSQAIQFRPENSHRSRQPGLFSTNVVHDGQQGPAVKTRG